MISSLALLVSLVVGDVISVGPDSQSDFSSVQAAVDAAADGDEIRVAPGLYAEDVDVLGKSLVLTGETGAILGRVSISNLASHQEVILRNLVTPTNGTAPGLFVNSCAGPVLVEECTLRNAVRYEGSELLVLNDSTISGGASASSPGLLASSTSETLVLHFSYVRGAWGSTGCDGGTGGIGAALANSNTFCGLSLIRGGTGGSATCSPGTGGNGGTGLTLSAGSSVVLSNSTLSGGGVGQGMAGGIFGSPPYGYPGYATGLALGSSLQSTNRTGRLFAPATVAPGAPVSITSSGNAGDAVWLVVSDQLQVQLNSVPGELGATFVAFQGAAFTGPEWQFLGTAPVGTGSINSSVNLPSSAVSANGRTYLQSVFVVAGTGEVYYGPLRIVDQRETEIGTAFCFGDGGDQLGCQDCPCGNNVAAGLRVGCSNGTGRGCRLFARGSTSVSAGDLRFDVEGANPNIAALLFSGVNALPANGLCPPGSGIRPLNLDGLLCVGGSKVRHGIRGTNSLFKNNVSWGVPNPPAGLAAAAGFTAGQTRRFQVSYREDPSLGCGRAIQTSNAVELVFTP